MHSAVKFIRDQAHATIDLENTDEKQKSDSMADLASATLRKILKSDSSKPSLEIRRETPDVTKGNPDPLDGWAEGVTLNKSHCCLLLKPQFILRGAEYKDTCIVTAGQAKLQAMSIMDTMHMNDPISGKVMSRQVSLYSHRCALLNVLQELYDAVWPASVLPPAPTGAWQQ